jgi:hypothetical protein
MCHTEFVYTLAHVAYMYVALQRIGTVVIRLAHLQLKSLDLIYFSQLLRMSSSHEKCE